MSSCFMKKRCGISVLVFVLLCASTFEISNLEHTGLLSVALRESGEWCPRVWKPLSCLKPLTKPLSFTTYFKDLSMPEIIESAIQDNRIREEDLIPKKVGARIARNVLKSVVTVPEPRAELRHNAPKNFELRAEKMGDLISEREKWLARPKEQRTPVSGGINHQLHAAKTTRTGRVSSWFWPRYNEPISGSHSPVVQQNAAVIKYYKGDSRER